MNSIDIQPLCAARLADYLKFFDTRAFSDNAEWSRCYCYFPYCNPATREWESRTSAENRAAIGSFVENGRAQGYLAYEDKEVVGWCNAAPYSAFPILDSLTDLDVSQAGAIVCFVVCPTRRGQGIAKALLDTACNGLKARGMLSVFAKPFKGASNSAENYPGPLSMYLAAGFSVVREVGKGNVLVRKALS